MPEVKPGTFIEGKKKIQRMFMRPDLEKQEKKIRKRIENQIGLGKGEKIKNTENFDSSDEDEKHHVDFYQTKQKSRLLKA